MVFTHKHRNHFIKLMVVRHIMFVTHDSSQIQQEFDICLVSGNCQQRAVLAKGAPNGFYDFLVPVHDFCACTREEEESQCFHVGTQPNLTVRSIHYWPAFCKHPNNALFKSPRQQAANSAIRVEYVWIDVMVLKVVPNWPSTGKNLRFVCVSFVKKFHLSEWVLVFVTPIHLHPH